MYRIINTTDGKYVGRTFNEVVNPIVLDSEDFNFRYEKILATGDMIVLSNSNYIILAREEA